ncbi:uncharacterized protein METZ01_LOCUS101162 [marine metagenome]|uniref:Uncharacterized protein n=1 Tax=marine metagenome TaxID=408172 RepID=A0A381W8J1_9ZZZZ
MVSKDKNNKQNTCYEQKQPANYSPLNITRIFINPFWFSMALF